MLETMNDYLGIAVILFIIVIAIVTFVSMNAKMRSQDESDEYYRDLL